MQRAEAAYTQMLDDIGAHANEHLKEIFKIYFDRFFEVAGDGPGHWEIDGQGTATYHEENIVIPKTVIQSWTAGEDGEFTLKLTRPLVLWVPSTEEKDEIVKTDPPGGVALILGGNPEKEWKVKITKQGDDECQVKNLSGFEVCADHSVLNKLKKFSPLVHLHYKDENTIEMRGGMIIDNWGIRKMAKLFAKVDGKVVSKDRSKPMSNFRNNWGKNGEPVIVAEGTTVSYLAIKSVVDQHKKIEWARARVKAAGIE